jgi:hypothetical protein
LFLVNSVFGFLFFFCSQARVLGLLRSSPTVKIFSPLPLSLFNYLSGVLLFLCLQAVGFIWSLPALLNFVEIARLIVIKN